MFVQKIGGLINQRLYTREGVQAYSKLPNIDDLRGQLCALLNQQLATLPNTIAMPIQSLSQALSQISQPEPAEK